MSCMNAECMPKLSKVQIRCWPGIMPCVSLKHVIRQVAKCRLYSLDGTKLAEEKVKPIGALCIVGAEFRSSFSRILQPSTFADPPAAHSLVDAMDVDTGVDAEDEEEQAEAHEDQEGDSDAEFLEGLALDSVSEAEKVLDVGKIFPSIVWSNVLPGGNFTLYI